MHLFNRQGSDQDFYQLQAEIYQERVADYECLCYMASALGQGLSPQLFPASLEQQLNLWLIWLSNQSLSREAKLQLITPLWGLLDHFDVVEFFL